MTRRAVTLLMPARSRFGGQRLSESAGRWFARADRSDPDGEVVQRQFDVLPRGWPVAAVTRQRDAGDAAGSAWMRADPVYIQPEINGARLMAHGDALALSEADTAAFLPALKPYFGDGGTLLDAPVPSRWYLQMPAGAKLPTMASLDNALGADLFEQLPDGPDGRRWRALLSEAQVILHNHPRNAERAALGLAPVNSLWFWGAGTLPDHVRTHHARISSDDDTLRAFGTAAGVPAVPLPARWEEEGDGLFDLRHLRDLAVFDRDWWQPLSGQLRSGGVASLVVEFADGHRLVMAPRHRWRFWRRPLRSFVNPAPESVQ
ncbi:hypothetical protein [Lysobacter sp. A03]|uniref:hypothetical protein n=1 Tax=Lysobacter sp. A03 TaxID=1199154 RepID=UPI0005B6C4DB|nr:hypothetical protein [Lysobacter sp. A03]KIQ96445.1 Regulatory protein, RpfE type [Lysobacter sp. A03]